MADTIRFRCKGCDKKIAVRAEYAGKKARCPGCKQPIRVPSPRPKRSATGVPIGAGSGVPSSSSSASGISLAELAAMEENATAELKELSPKAAAQPATMRVPGGKECPGCGASVKPEAAICVHCGHSFESGKQLKTKKDSKVGKALSSVKDTATNAEISGSGLVLSFRFVIGGGALCALGIAMAFFDFRPDGEDSSSSKSEFMADVLAFLFDTIGGMAAGGILMTIGLVLVAHGLGIFKRMF